MKTLVDYKEIIMGLPSKEKYTKEDLLIPALLLDKDKQLEIYYAPHNEFINTEAKLVIVGITPGFEQMRMAIEVAKEGFEEGKALQTVQYECKVAARFTGSLRKNMVEMLDEIGLHSHLGLATSAVLFESDNTLMHTFSLVPYPVFKGGANYTGHTPKLLKSIFLMDYVREHFERQTEQLKDKAQLVIIPLGRAVEEVLLQLQEEGRIQEGRILKGFPHPSGANVNRKKQLEEAKENLMRDLSSYFNTL